MKWSHVIVMWSEVEWRMALLHSTSFYITLPCLYFTLYFILHDTAMAVLHSTCSTLLYHGSTSLYISLQWLYSRGM